MPAWVLKIVPMLGVAFIKFVHLTARYKVEGAENLAGARSSHGRVILVCWHQRLMGTVLTEQKRSVGAVISKSDDGELISRAVKKLGFVPLRGSSSRGGAVALKAVFRHLEGGNDVVFTPDGPRGPRFTMKPGAAYAAQRSGAPVVPLAVASGFKKVFASWDRFQLPLPFSRIQVVYGKPLAFAREEPIEDIEKSIREGLMKVTLRADELLGVTSP